jgi:hypothetical protein
MFGSTLHCSLCEHLDYKIPFKVIMFPNISYVPYNFYNAWALKAKNNSEKGGQWKENEEGGKVENAKKGWPQKGTSKYSFVPLCYHDLMCESLNLEI